MPSSDMSHAHGEARPAPMQAWSTRLDHRLRRVSWGVQGVLITTSVVYAVQGRPATAWALAFAVVGLSVLPLVRRRWGFNAAADAMLWVLASMLVVLAVVGSGLRDAAIVAFPALLTFAVMLRRFKTLWWLLAAQILGIAGLWWAQISGWWPPRVGPSGILLALNLGSIVCLTAWASYLVSQDQTEALEALTEENLRVSQALDRLDHATRHDALTGLPNRRAAVMALDRMCARLTDGPTPTAVLLLNLDSFKTVNESLGPELGDQYLTRLADRLRAHQSTPEQVYRIGSDEFLVLLADAADASVPLVRARSWIDVIGLPVALAGLHISITASGGLARFPTDGSSPKELLLKADLALQRAKEGGRNVVRLYDPAMGGGGVDQLQMLADMRQALARGDFELHYQPKFQLNSGRCCGAEALLRWRHPRGHWISPGTFIPLAERSGLINDLGAWVLRQVCEQVAAWRASHGDRVFPVAVNVSMVQFRKGDLFDVVYQSLQQCGLPGALLELEITESLLSDSGADAERTLARLRQLGVSFAIDDFGTGYSNLGYLKRFEIHTLKIDQSFVRRLAQGGSEEAIVHAIVTMAERLGLATVAEGIEDEPTARLLAELGCEMGQGYLWSPAIPAADFERRYLNSNGQPGDARGDQAGSAV